MAPNPARPILITIDVEALPKRAPEDHVNRLIWGRSNNKSFGIQRMMDIADEFGVKLVFFLDYAEFYLYGDPFVQVAKDILSRGHDLQLHCHIDVIPEPDWRRITSGAYRTSLNRIPFAVCDALLSAFSEVHQSIGAPPFLGYRGGAFRYSKAWIDALHKHDIPMSFNYFPAMEHQLVNVGDQSLFRWDNGIIEVALTMLRDPLVGRNRRLEFNSWKIGDNARIISLAAQQIPKSKPLCLLMHSWSFGSQDENGFYVYPNEYWVDHFRAMLWHLKDNHIVPVTCAELLKETGKDGSIVIEKTVPLAEFERPPATPT